MKLGSQVIIATALALLVSQGAMSGDPGDEQIAGVEMVPSIESIITTYGCRDVPDCGWKDPEPVDQPCISWTEHLVHNSSICAWRPVPPPRGLPPGGSDYFYRRTTHTHATRQWKVCTLDTEFLPSQMPLEIREQELEALRLGRDYLTPLIGEHPAVIRLLEINASCTNYLERRSEANR